jgi:diguanylate cyclase (GGDEF)-like protein
MTMRARVLLYAISTLALIGLIQAVAMGWLQWSSLRQETELRARTFVDTVAVAATADLAAMRIEDLDRAMGSLVQRNMETLDVRFVSVLDPDGRVVAHSDQRWYGRMATEPLWVDAVHSDLGLLREATFGDRPVIVASRPVVSQVPGATGARWGTVIAGVGVDRISQAVVRLLVSTLIVTLLSLVVLGVLLDQLFVNRLTRPLRDVVGAVQQYARGDLTARAPLARNDEVRVVASGFNDMAARIERHTRDLEEQIRDRTASLAAANQELSQANAALEALATTDELTDLYNFRYFRATMANELHRSHRTGAPVALLILDVDYFKRWNDRFGHPSGDQALRTLAALLKSRLRRTDIACRYGGEEFAIILVNTGMQGALHVAEGLRAAVEAAEFGTDDGTQLTVSVGVAVCPDHATELDTLVKAADDALYRVKGMGRNRVVSVGGEPMEPEQDQIS